MITVVLLGMPEPLQPKIRKHQQLFYRSSSLKHASNKTYIHGGASIHQHVSNSTFTFMWEHAHRCGKQCLVSIWPKNTRDARTQVQAHFLHGVYLVHWVCLESLWPTWTPLDFLGFGCSMQAHWDLLRLTWTYSVSLGLIWARLDSFDLLWIHLDSLTESDEGDAARAGK